MTAPIRLYDLGPSPNSKKIRLALGYKGIPYELIPVNPADRADIVRLSGQPLTPVLAHGDTIIFDSGAILRYLDANVKREPALFSADYDRMKAIEGWESWARTQASPPIGQLFGQFFAASRDADAIRGAGEALNAAGRHVESKLSPGGYLCGDAPTAADIVCASWFSLGLLPPEAAAKHPVLQFFHENLRVDPELQGLRRWYQSLDRFDL